MKLCRNLWGQDRNDWDSERGPQCISTNTLSVLCETTRAVNETYDAETETSEPRDRDETETLE